MARKRDIEGDGDKKRLNEGESYRKWGRDQEIKRQRERERHTQKIDESISDYLSIIRTINIRTYVTILPVRTATPSWSKKKDKSVAWTVSQLNETNPVLFDSDGPVLGP